MLDSPEKYKKGVAFYAARSTFFLPEEEMTEEEFSAAYARMFCEKKKRPIVSLEKFEKKKRK